ncbi:hypothetical protein [Curtobacterium luteum]|uniref:hypothetical protein n=1 Tax=Curtobacterium luteum TaxID=33881 RepID=UPI00073620D5|nr:hypothetical protein [Curtobacterium luteum]
MQRWGTVRTAVVGVLGPALVGLVVAVVGWLRLGPVAARTVWAEDGGVFLRERVADGPWDLLQPYAGYLHLVPRLVVDAAWALPVERYALALSLGSCCVVGAAAALVFVLARPVVGPWPLRALLASVPALLPLAPYEIAGNAANLHWFLLALAPWVFAYRPRSRWSAAGLALVAGAVTLTEPQAVLFVPLLLLAWFPRPARRGGRPDLRALPVTVVALVGATAQVLVALSTPRTAASATPRPLDIAAGWLLQPVGGLYRPGATDVVRSVLAHGWWVAVVPALGIVALLVAAVVVGGARARWIVVAMGGASFVVWAAALYANGVDSPWAHPTPALAEARPLRYAAASGLLLLSAAATAAGVLVTWADGRGGIRGASRSGRTGGAARLAGAAAGWSGVALVVTSVVIGVAPQVLDHAPAESRRAAGPVWAPQMAAAAATCRADRGLDLVRVQTAPWSAKVPCERLR